MRPITASRGEELSIGNSWSIETIRHYERMPRGGPRASLPDLGKLVHLDQPDEFIPFDVRQPNAIRPFSDRYALISDHNLWTFRAIRAKGGFDGVHLRPP
jgi:hypothetical protein